MSDLFQGALFIILVVFIIGLSTVSNFQAEFEKLKPYDGYIVVEKKKMAGVNYIILQKEITAKDDPSVYFMCYDIMYQSFEVGDTLDYSHYEQKYFNK